MPKDSMPKIVRFPVPIIQSEELSADKIAFCHAYAADPSSVTYGNAAACSRALRLNPTHVYQWLKDPAVRTVISAYLERHKDWTDQVQGILQAAGLEMAGKLIAGAKALEDQRLHTPKSYLAAQQGVPEEEVVLPDAGSQEWDRIERAVAMHNRNYLELHKQGLKQAELVVAHAIGHPALKADVHHHKDTPDQSDLAREIRKLSPAAQEKLLQFVRGASDLLELPDSTPREISPPEDDAEDVETEDEGEDPAP